jgi:hypothetical protein
MEALDLVLPLFTKKAHQQFSFTLIRKYLQQLIINADKQGASKEQFTMSPTLSVNPFCCKEKGTCLRFPITKQVPV